MNELFQVDIENLNLIQLARWIKQCRTAIQPSDRPIYTEYPYRYQEAVAEFCNEYIEFFNANKGILTSTQFDRALKLSVLKSPRYVTITSDGVEIDITEYSCAAKPPVRKRGNRLSGRMETIVIPVRRSRLSGVA